LPLFQRAQKTIEFLDYERAEPVLPNNRFALPGDLTGSPDVVRRAWPRWLQGHDREIRSRIVRGEEDTLVNFVLFGVSFTDRPRVSLEQVDSPAAIQRINERIQHFIAALEKPATDRLKLLEGLLTRLGYDSRSPAQRERLRAYISSQVARYVSEWRQYQAAVGRSLANDVTAPSNANAGLYKSRGLSVDTDFRPNYAIEQALQEVKQKGLLRSVKRVAVIGPGLDFTDKDSGFDYYPLQTLQPFALIDSLLRLGMARSSDLEVSVFDISSQPLDHLSQAITRARSRESYTVQLVLDRALSWNAGALNYWRHLGDRIGSETAPMPATSQIQNVERRAIRIQPQIVTLLNPQSMNIISQHVTAPADQRFDLVVATNIFLYYDRFELALALLNVESMLSSGGLLLTNDAIEDYAGVKLRTVGSASAQYTPSQADTVRIYSIPRFQPQIAPA
jgi:hypothetical protein